MQNLYNGDNLTVTRQTDGSVFLIRQNERPQTMMTLTDKEWLHMLTMEMMTNPKIQQISEILKQHEEAKK
jgi:hypothetical protein